MQPCHFNFQLGRAKRFWYLSHMRAAKVQASLRIRAVSPEPPLLAHTSSESRGTFRQKARSLAPLNGWACAVKICQLSIKGKIKDTTDNKAEQLNSVSSSAHVVNRLLRENPKSIPNFSNGNKLFKNVTLQI